jgi:hypothetical protein
MMVKTKVHGAFAEILVKYKLIKLKEPLGSFYVLRQVR